ncbi:MAG: DUF2764 family protein [Bacteroidetes bacterium]|jgi:hypothetical protein|nr:DUF2764 family protein [Bacteroidota bacterium]
MMAKRRYYYFVSGLADLLFDSGGNLPDMAEFRLELKNNLHPDDYYLSSILFLPYDNRNLISFLEGNEDHWEELGNYSRDTFEEYVRFLEPVIQENDKLPDYMVKVISENSRSEEGLDVMKVRKLLYEGYVKMAFDSGNRFLKEWVVFETDLKNIFSFLNAKSLDIDPEPHMIGDNSFTEELLELFRSGKDFSMSFESEYASAIFKIAMENEFIEREKRIDLFRWNYIDSITFFEYFSIDMILGYLIKYSIVRRWLGMDPETGRNMLQHFIKDTESRIISGTVKSND